ncbi:hypothetical protein [Methylobacterium sp. E-066]|uniref:hypothetical protein n=1 Tax=Methylobacterium sp. E-066 TaxID=2836584 RepID=UPI001FBB9098|nr:hypothetical protein [Methylobacterium sp. E-066]MCJ2138461.1 hypothetical protein [Methylobacterium sp. E-066]
MDNDNNLDPQVFYGAMNGARAGLAHFGISADDEICTQVAVMVLTGFAMCRGLEPESLERLRDITLRAWEASEKLSHDA